MADIIEMPKLSDTMTDGVLVKWLKHEGDSVKSGDMLAEVETDKATMELESFFDGTLLRIFAPPGARVPIGSPLCAIGKPGEQVAEPERPAPKAESGAPKTDSPAEKSTEAAGGQKPSTASPRTPAAGSQARPPASSPTPPTSPAGDRVRISPLARRLAAERGIDPATIQGSGPGGRIVRADIESAPKTSPVGNRHSQIGDLSGGPIQPEEVVPVSNMRATIARRLTESKSTIPHFQLEIEIDAAPIITLREQLNGALEADGVKLSLNDFVMKAAAGALRRVPAVNCSWEPATASAQESIRRHPSAHISFAVAIEDGLITPVIRDCHRKSLFAISAEVKSLAARARDKKLTPAEFTGGTFCVSNLGMMGIDRFNAIINPPNAAILAVGTAVRKPVVAADGRIVPGDRMSLTLSCDHRVVDGATGATWLGALRELLEKPALLLL